MESGPKPLSGSSSVAEWLNHPEGGPVLRELLEQSGIDERALAAVSTLPVQELRPAFN